MIDELEKDKRFAINYRLTRSTNKNNGNGEVTGRVTSQLLKETFTSEPKETAVLCVGTKAMEREGYKMFSDVGFKNKLLSMGVRNLFFGRKNSPLVLLLCGESNNI